jgi:glycosyltransferase involved in cell wall biosynthesis
VKVRNDGSVAVLIPSFGNAAFWNLQAARAIGSVAAQTRPPDDLIRHHFHTYGATADTLGTLRNTLATLATTEWLCFLDADDELEPGYIAAMLEGEGDVRYPKVRMCVGTPDEKILLPEAQEIPARRNLLEGNHIVIGAFIRRDFFLKLGGFDDWPTAEDWTLWIKAWLEGAKIQHVPGAIYRQNWRPGTRNQPEPRYYQMICGKIRERYRPLAERRGLVGKVTL